MADPKPTLGGGLEPLYREMDDLRRGSRINGGPAGSARRGTSDQADVTVAYLESLKTYAATASGGTISNVAADGVIRWYTPGVPATIVADVPTRRAIVTASVGEASITPNGGFVIAYIDFVVTDALGTVIKSAGNSSAKDAGRLYFNQRFGAGMSTGATAIDMPASALGPFTFGLRFGTWVQGSTNPGTFVFNKPTLRVEIVDPATTS